MTALTRVFAGGSVLDAGALVSRDVVVVGHRIAAVGDDGEMSFTSDGSAELIDCRGLVVAPGFIDLQCNGAVGVDITTEPHRIADVAAALPRFGVTGFLPTVVTCPPSQRSAALAALPSARAEVGPGAATPIALHFEGPALSPHRLGAHPATFVVEPRELDGEIDEWIGSGDVALVTMAPELEGASSLIARLSDGGITVSAGHTTMSPIDLERAKSAGLRSVTHLFNAMTPFGHRDPGPIGAALADDDVVVGLICDGVHVDPIAVAVAWKALGPSRTSLVSDSVAALGEPYGLLRLGGVEVTHDETGVRTLDGTLAGSALPLDQAVRNLMSFTGCSLADAVGTVTSVPADLLGLSNRGRLAVGARADLVVLEPNGHLVATIVGGRTAHGTL